MKAKRFSRSLSAKRLVLVVLLAGGGQAWSQTGVAPSQTSSFFDDLRKRSEALRTPAVDESVRQAPTAGVYDFSRGEYVGESYEDPRALGARPPFGDEIFQARSFEAPRAGYAGTTKRSAGDYTGASASPYPSTSSFFAPTYITDPFLAGKRNIKIGPLNIGLGLNSNFEYNDNITQAHENQLDDIIGGLYLNVDANWQLTARNRLSISATLGVDHYFQHPEESPRGKEYNFTVFPGSTMSFDFDIGEFHFVFYDRISIRQESPSEFTLDDQDVFGVFQNDIGLAMNWDLNSRTVLTLNYNRSDSIALESSDASNDRTINSLSGSVGFTPSGTYTTGLEGSYSIVDYVEIFNNDGTTLSAGVFFATPVTRNTLIKFSFGVQRFEFDTPPSFTRTVFDTDVQTAQNNLDTFDAGREEREAAIDADTSLDPAEKRAAREALEAERAGLEETLDTTTDERDAQNVTENSRSFDNNSDYTDYYFNVTILNQLNSRVSHQLSFGHESSLNTSSNFVSADFASYGVGMILAGGARLSLSGYYENAQDSGGRLAESSQQYGVDALLTHRLTDNLTLALGYHHGTTDKDALGRDYVQESYSIDFNFAVNEKLNLGLGYRHLVTTAEVEQQSFDQNRFILSLNYNF